MLTAKSEKRASQSGLREATLRDFFLGVASAEDLAADLAGALVPGGESVTFHPIVDMGEEFEVTPNHLVRLCDAVLAGLIAPDSLQAVGFCVVASDSFHWADTPAGEVVAETVHDWSAPLVNYPLSLVNVAQFRARLLGMPAQFNRV
jgi:hypothetical protein